jgi:hypothetical protein
MDILMPRLKGWTKGDDLKAAHLNEPVEELNRRSNPPSRAGAMIDIFALTEAPTFPSGGSASSIDTEPTPYAKAKRLWLHLHGESDDYASYQTLTGDNEDTLWFPQCPVDDDGYATETDLGDVGSRVAARWNRQSGRWEVVSASTAAPSASVYQIIFGDLDYSAYTIESKKVCYANPCTFNESTWVWEDLEDGVLGEYSVIAIPGSTQFAAWLGDLIECESASITLPDPYDAYSAVRATRRISQQMTFQAVLNSVLNPGSYVGATVLINGLSKSKIVYASGSLITQLIPQNVHIDVVYRTDVHQFIQTIGECS